MPSRQKGKPASAMPPIEEQNDGDTQETGRRYGFRQTTLHARPALPDLPRSRRTVTAGRSSFSEPTALAKGADRMDETADEIADPMDEISDMRRNLRAEDTQWTNSLPMPHVEKITCNNNLAATIGQGKPPSGRASVQPRSASDGVLRAGSKRNLEDVSDADNARSPKLVCSASVFNHNNSESTSSPLRRSVSGTVPGWRANRTSSPRQPRGAAASSGREPQYDPEEDRQSLDEEEMEEGERTGEGAEAGVEEEVEEDPEGPIDDGHPVDESANDGDALSHGITITTKKANPKTKAADKHDSTAKHQLAARGRHSPAPTPVGSSQPVPSAARMQGGLNHHPPAPVTSSQPVSFAAGMQGDRSRRSSAPATPSQPAPTTTGARGGKQAKRPPGHYSRAVRSLRRLARDPVTRVEEEQRTQDTSRSSGEKQNWTIERLPAGTDLTKWNLCIIPRFIRYFVCFGQPWDANKYLDYAQRVWQKIFPESRFILTGKNDAVYPLLRQHIYDFRSGFAERAERAVEDFFRKYTQFAEPARIQAYVRWAVPPARVKTNGRGQTIMLEDHVFPYMYKYNNEHQMDGNDVLRGVFRHECILNTFAHYLEVIDHLPVPAVNTEKPPRNALALAAVAVERALKQWSKGWFEPDMANFSATEWGAETFDLLAATNDLPEAKWERIIREASGYIARYRKLGTSKANFTTRILSKQLSGRATILSSDGEDSDASMASDANQ
ncbi:hypothetical protein F5887DRAFT_1078857 [Amanita rubescens]|nr:hypothetical protein F5887DRAFT_1078857 [Amanita rubescens]